jgi:hypothetical protein
MNGGGFSFFVLRTNEATAIWIALARKQSEDRLKDQQGVAYLDKFGCPGILRPATH